MGFPKKKRIPQKNSFLFFFHRKEIFLSQKNVFFFKLNFVFSKKFQITNRREVMQMQRDSELNEVQKQHLVHKLQDQAAEIAQLDVEEIIYDSNKKRMDRAKQRMDYFTRFADIISETMTLSEIFWSLMQLDMERMKNRNKYDSRLEAYRIDSLACNRRIVSICSFLSCFFISVKIN